MSDETSNDDHSQNRLSRNPFENLDIFDIDCEGSHEIDPSDQQQNSSLDILSQKTIKIGENFIIKWTSDGIKNYDKDARRSCKILEISSACAFGNILVILDSLKHGEYPNLFIFIIESKDVRFYASGQSEGRRERRNIKMNRKFAKIKNILMKFGLNRSIILQLKSEEENVIKFYYKEHDSTHFLSVDKNQDKFSKSRNFSSFICAYMRGQYENGDDVMIEKHPEVQNSSLILRFLSIFKTDEKLKNKLILKCAACGSKNDLLAALDAPFEGDGRLLNNEAQDYLSDVIYREEPSNESTVESAEEQRGEEDETFIDAPSVLHTAVQHENKEVINFLISHCTHLIQQLPFEHQVRISTTAFESNQLDVLCDLLEYCDFPFPQKFKIDHERLRGIAEQRTKLQFAIAMENFEDISSFIDSNLSLKIAYNTSNKSALKQAAELKKFNIYYHLKSLGFQATEFSSLGEVLNTDEMKEAKKHKIQQRKKNVNDALSNQDKAINSLCNKSFIHNRKINREQEAQYRLKIRKWFEDINKIKFGFEMLKVVASCEQLKIIFDFESDSVENVGLTCPNAAGSMFPSTKWIFVGAKLSDSKREQQIKGVLAHELCHYVMKLVYENKENPYYKHAETITAKYKTIVNEIDKWSSENSENPDDECNGIISSVFQMYECRDFNAELVVRVMQILAEFDDDEEKLASLQKKYEKLFSYFQKYVLPDLQKFDLKSRNNVKKMNRAFGLLSDISSLEIEFEKQNYMRLIINSKCAIVESNIPKLLLLDIYKLLSEESGDLLCTQNVFVDPKKLENQETQRNFKNLLEENSDLNIFIDGSKESCEKLQDFVVNTSSKLIFIVSSEDQSKALAQSIVKKDACSSIMTMNYNWNDLTKESQKYLLQTKITFQNQSNFSLLDVLTNKNHSPGYSLVKNLVEQEENILNNLAKIIEEQLLNLLVAKLKIAVNSKIENENETKLFDFLFQQRTLTSKKWYREEMTPLEMLREVCKKVYVLISDIAGTGKSWIMKIFTNLLREQNPTRWVTYVDLKQHIKEFEDTDDEIEFSSFMVEKLLKPKNKFEGLIFKKLYKSGKVFILFDGFDEIAPNCAEFVSKLAQSFEYNAGNQLWIATRDYFEIDLMDQLKLDGGDVFKLSDLTKEDATDFVAKSWLLKDLDIDLIKSKDEFESHLKASTKFEEYQEVARLLIEKLSFLRSRSIGMVQLYRMIADGFKDDKDVTLNLREFKIFEKFAERLYERWSSAKGEIRKEANTKSQKNDLNFWKFHQYSAIKSLFPQSAKVLFPKYDKNEWCDEEIIACGLISKQDGNFYFLHETFREFFVADYIAKFLKNFNYNEELSMTSRVKSIILRINRHEDCVFDLFIEILKVEKYGIIRMFLNDAFECCAVLEQIQEKILKSGDNFLENFHCFHSYFTQNLDNLVDLIITIVKSGNYKRIKKILKESVRKVFFYSTKTKVFQKYQEFLFEILKVEDLKALIIQQEVLQCIVSSSIDFEVFEEFLTKITTTIGFNFIQDLLEWTIGVNKLIHCLCDSPAVKEHKVQKFFTVIQKYIKISKLFRSLSHYKQYLENIFHVCIQEGNAQKLKIIWTGLKSFFASQNRSSHFVELVCQQGFKNKNILHYAADWKKPEIHEALWELLLKTFEYYSSDLYSLALQKDENGNDFIHDLVESNKNSIIIQFTLNMLRENLNDTKLNDILNSTNRLGRNLLHASLIESKDNKNYQIIWKTLRNVCESDNGMLEFLKQIDTDENNPLHDAVKYSSDEAIKFLVQMLEKSSFSDVKKLLGSLNGLKQNLLQIASVHKNSLKLHQKLWKLYHRYFEQVEMIAFVKDVDKFNDNLLFGAVRHNKKEILELVWSEVTSLMKEDEQIKYLNFTKNDGKNLFETALENQQHSDVYEWIRTLRKANGMHSDYDIFFDITSNTLHDPSEEIFELIIDYMVKLPKSEVSKKIFKRYRTVFEQNLLQIAAERKSCISVHENLWAVCRKNFKTSEILQLVKQKSKLSNNVLLCAVEFNTKEVVEFTWNQIKSLLDDDKQVRYLKVLGMGKMNILDLSLHNSLHSGVHELIKDILHTYRIIFL